MAKLGATLKQLATQAGLQDLEELKSVFNLENEITDETANKFTSSFLTLESAKNNSALVNHFKAQTLLPLDSEITKLAGELGLPPEVLQALQSEKSSYAKPGLVLKAALAEAEKKYAAKGGDKDEQKREIERLNLQLGNLPKQHEEAINKLKADHDAAIMNMLIDQQLVGLQYSDAIPEPVRLVSAKALLEKSLAEKKAKIVKGADGQIKLVSAENAELDYYENNAKVNFADFIKGSTAAMLKVSGQTQPPANTQQQQFPNTPNNNRNQHIANQIGDANAEFAKQLG